MLSDIHEYNAIKEVIIHKSNEENAYEHICIMEDFPKKLWENYKNYMKNNNIFVLPLYEYDYIDKMLDQEIPKGDLFIDSNGLVFEKVDHGFSLIGYYKGLSKSQLTPLKLNLTCNKCNGKMYQIKRLDERGYYHCFHCGNLLNLFS